MKTFELSIFRGFGSDLDTFSLLVDADTIEEIFNNNVLSGKPSFIRFNKDCVSFQITFDWTCFIEVYTA